MNDEQVRPYQRIFMILSLKAKWMDRRSQNTQNSRGSWFFSLGTLISRISGFLREVVLATTFGGSVWLDSFYVAYRIPHLFRDMLAEGALGSSLSKNYAQRTQQSRQLGTQLALNTLILTLSITSILTALGILFRSPFVSMMTFYGDETQQTLRLTTEALTAWLFPLMICSSVGAVFSGMLAYQRRFFVISVSPVLCNLGTLGGVFILAPYFQLMAQGRDVFGLSPLMFSLALGTLGGGVAQLALLALPCLNTLIRGIPRLSFRQLFHLNSPHVRVFRQSVPMLITGGVAQLQVIVSTNFASSLAEGTVSWLHLSFRLFQLPVGLFAVASATVILPRLATQISDKPLNTFELTHGISRLFWILSFCMFVTLMSATDIIHLIYYGGSFLTHDSTMTALTLQAYAVGMIGYGIMKILLSYFYATETTRYVLWLSCGSLVLSTFSHLIFLDIYGHVGMAAVTSLFLSLQALILGWIIYHKHNQSEKSHLIHSLFGSLVAGGISVVLILTIQTQLPAFTFHPPPSSSTFSLKLYAAGGFISKSLMIICVFGLCYQFMHRPLIKKS